MKYLLSLFLVALLLSPRTADAQTVFTYTRGVNVSHWLAQMPPNGYGDPNRFDREDMAWIAAHGYDHVRIPVDGRVLLDDEGRLIEDRMVPVEQALSWADSLGLGVILDMHYLEGANFTPVDNSLFARPDLQERAASLWQQIARHFAEMGPGLRFEVLNEAVADEHDQVSDLNERLLGAVRQVSPDRVVYVSSNRWGQFQTAPHVRVFDDPNVQYVFHYYEPFLFTHQGASWTEIPEVYPKSVEFPTTLTGLADEVPEGHWIRSLEGVALDEDRVDEDFAELAAWADANGVGVIVNEFGVYNRAPRESAYRWTQAVRRAAERQGFGWTVWDYEGGFAVRGSDGQPTVIHQALMTE